MTATASERPRMLAHEYAAALHAYVAGAGEAALARAYELGRRAAGESIGLLDLAMIHHQALAAALGTQGGEAVTELAAQFFAECLTPFEMTLRAYQSNARLLGLGEAQARPDAESDPRGAARGRVHGPALPVQRGREGPLEIDLAREQLRMILDATTAVIYLKDAEGRYLFVNRQFQEVFGVSRQEVIGQLDADLLPAEVAEQLRRDDREVLEVGAPRELEEAIPTHDGVHTYISLKFPLLDLAGTAYALCCVATDITERKRAAEELRHAKEATEDANRELESFSFSVAHDLRAPLRSIDGFSQALLEDCAGQLDAVGKRHLQRVRDAAQHMGELIDGLLVLSRVTCGELHWEPVDLSQLARAIAGRLRTVPDAQREVELVVQDGLHATGDARLLGIALGNLLGNAWKFTSKRAQARIEVGGLIEAGGPVWFVRDNGAGFDMTNAGRLFGTFQRLHPASEFEGHGIGLATVQRIVHRHHGRIWAEGQPDVGATFYFTVGESAAS